MAGDDQQFVRTIRFWGGGLLLSNGEITSVNLVRPRPLGVFFGVGEFFDYFIFLCHLNPLIVSTPRIFF